MLKYSNIETLLRRVVRAGLYAALFMPFLFWQTFMFPFVTLKVFGFHILTELIFGAWLLYLFLRRERPVLTRLALAVLVFLAVLLVTAATGVNFERSFWSTDERGIGIFSILHFAAFFLILSDSLRRGVVRLDSYLKTAFFAAAGVSAGAVLQLYKPQFFLSGDYRTGSFLGNPAYLAGYAIFAVFLGLWLASRSASPAWRWSFLILTAFQTAVIVVATETRSAILGLGAGMLFLLTRLALTKNEGMKSRKVARFVLALLFVFAAVFWFTRAAPAWQNLPGVGRLASLAVSTTDVQPRLLAWKIAWDSFLERPLAGWGFENFKYAMDKNFHPSLFRYGFGETYWDKPHNIFLEYLVAGGVLGLAAFIYLLAVAFRAVYRLPPGILFAAALAAHLVSNFFVFDTFGTYLMFFTVLAVADSAAPAAGWVKTAVSKTDAGGGRSGVFRFIPAAAAVTAIAFLMYLNVSIIYANNRHYWGANYFVNDMPAEGLNAFRQALDVKFNPYVGATRRDFGSLATQMYTQGRLPEPEKNLPWAVAEVDKAIGGDQKDYYLYLTLADMIVNFYELNPGQLLKIGPAAINKAIELSPNRQQNYYVKAKLHLLKGEKEAALQAMEKAVALDPAIGDPHFYYALTLLEVGETAKGFEELETAGALGRAPRSFEEKRIVANYYGDAGDWERAVFWYRAALLENPGDSEARLKLGLVYYMSGKREPAKKEIQEVMQKTDLTKSPAYELLLPILRDLELAP